MRIPYETPKVTMVGSVKDLTLGANPTLNADNVFGIPVPGGPPGLS